MPEPDDPKKNMAFIKTFGRIDSFNCKADSVSCLKVVGPSISDRPTLICLLDDNNILYTLSEIVKILPISPDFKIIESPTLYV